MRDFERAIKDAKKALRWLVNACTKLANETGDETYRWAEQEFQYVLKQITLYRRLLYDLKSASVRNRRARKKQLTTTIMESYPARLVAMLRVHASTKRVVSAEEIIAFAESISMGGCYGETVTVKPHPKNSIKWRPIALTGLKRRAQQLILRDILLVRDGDSPCDSTVAGAGGERAHFRKFEAFIKEGYTHFVSIDVIQFFPSVKPGHLAGFPLSPWAIENLVFLPQMTPIMFIDPVKGISVSEHDLLVNDADPFGCSSLYSSESVLPKLKMVRQGLPQGDVLSPQIARMFLGREIQRALGNRGVKWFTHLDDCLICARSPSKLRSALKTLVKRLAHHPAGPIELHDHTIRHVDEDFFHIGYRAGLRKDGTLHVRPGLKRFDRFRERLRARLAASPTFAKGELIAIGIDYAKAWFDAQHAWTKAPADGSSRHSGRSWEYVLCEVRECVNQFIYEEFLEGTGGWSEDDIDFTIVEETYPHAA